jgi:cytidylate kinase-like protein
MLAGRLHVPFLDRAVPLEYGGQVRDRDDPEAPDEVAGEGLLDRLLRGVVGMDSGAPTPAPTNEPTADDVREQIEAVLFRQAASGEGVILGRGAVAVLRDDPRALRVRLTGPARARTTQAAELAGIDVEEAERRRCRLDRAHADYLRRFYSLDVDDLALYHVALDTTTMPYEAAVELLVGAAASFC